MTSRPFAAVGLALALALPGCSDGSGSALAPAPSIPPGPLPRLVELPPPQPVTPKAEPKKAAPPRSTTAKDLIESGTTSARTGDMAAALRDFDQAVVLDPANRRGWFLIAAATQDRANQADDDAARSVLLHRSAVAARKLRSIAKSLDAQETGLIANVLYNEACAYAIDKKDDQAVETLTEAVDSGFDNLASLLTDKELDSIRDRPELAPLIARAQIAQRAKVRADLKAFKPFPFHFDLPALDGKSIALADLKGKVAIVDFWGTWCPPCRLEIPHFVALHKKYGDKGLAIIGVNYEKGPKERHKGMIASFVTQFEIPYPCVLGDEKTQELVPEFKGYPTTLFIDRAGTVRLQLTGYTPMPQLEAIVTALLDEAPPKTTAP